MKYCCDRFERAAKLPNTSSPNIRIIKFEASPKLSDKIYYGFYITMGYETFSLHLPKMMIEFCPFCGTNLKKHYKTDDYVNEFEGKTFSDSNG